MGPIPNITIRYATPDDAEAIASLLFESFVEYESLYTPEGFARLYERFGFQRTSDEPHELFGTPLFTMEKPSKVE